MELARQLRVLPLLVKMHVRSRMEYRGAYLVDRLAMIFAYASAFAAIWLLTERFQTLGGWAWPEMALLLGFQLLGYSLGAALSWVQFRDLEDLVQRGTFDVLLVKPISPWAYMVFSGLNINYAGQIVVALVLLVWSLGQLDIAWSAATMLYAAASLVSALLITAALMTMIGASALIFVRSSHLFAIFFGFWDLTRYPLNIFPTGLQAMLLTVVPMGFMSFVPVAWLLGKDIPIIGAWGGLAAPLVGPALVLLAMAHWRYAIGRYQGGGG